MKIIIFAGGSGKRFWPASRKSNPKQFQDVIENKPLIKLKYEYLRLGFKPEDIYLSTGIEYKNEVEHILSELPKENFIYEPSMRDTGPAVLFATEYIYRKFGDVIISLQWADHYIKNPGVFINMLMVGESVVAESNKSIVVGVPARFATQNRGYIKNGTHIKTFSEACNTILADFEKFVEKPTIDIAKEYVKSGDYTWNTGYFITKPSLVFEKYKQHSPITFATVKELYDSNSAENKSKFESLEKISFDYIFAENLDSSDAFVLISEMGWSDVGEWVTLKEALQKEDKDVVIKGNVLDLNSTDSLIYNYDDTKMVSTFDLNGLVIVNTKDAVAIFPKEKSYELKQYIKMLEEKGLQKYL